MTDDPLDEALERIRPVLLEFAANTAALTPAQVAAYRRAVLALHEFKHHIEHAIARDLVDHILKDVTNADAAAAEQGGRR